MKKKNFHRYKQNKLIEKYIEFNEIIIEISIIEMIIKILHKK